MNVTRSNNVSRALNTNIGHNIQNFFTYKNDYQTLLSARHYKHDDKEHATLNY